MKSYDDQEINLERYGADFSKAILDEIFSLFTVEKQTHGEDFYNRLILTMLGSFVCTVIFNRLKNTSLDTQNVELVNEDFQMFKRAIENTISTGFEEAFVNYAGSSVDYFTQITPAPEPINKLMC